MKTPLTCAILAALGTTAAVAETKALDPHVHGIASLQIVQEGTALAVTLDSPAASLLGFEHAPKTEEQHTAVEQLTVQLAAFTGAFQLDAAAGCSVVESDIDVLAELDHDDEHYGDEHHDEHEDEHHGDEHHDEHEDGHHGDEHHDEHEDEHHEDEHHDEHEDEHHGDEDHDEHEDEHHEDEHHDEHDHDDHGDEGSVHSEVNAAWTLNCESPSELASIDVLLFDGNAFLETVSVEMLLESGPRVQELTPGNTVITLK